MVRARVRVRVRVRVEVELGLGLGLWFGSGFEGGVRSYLVETNFELIQLFEP